MSKAVMGNDSKDVNNGTQIHLTTRYTRNKGGKKEKPKRAFNFVIGGLLISASLVGAVLAGGNHTEASTKPVAVPISTVHTQQNTEESVMIRNLNMATNALQLAISQGDINSQFYDAVMKNLLLIDGQINAEGKFTELNSLNTVLKNTEKALFENITTQDTEAINARQGGLDALSNLRDSIYKERSTGFTDIKDTSKMSARTMVSPASGKTSYSLTQVATSYKKFDSKKASTYQDYKAKQYWSKGMDWVVAKGYLNVYKNTKHPTTHKKGNWLNPSGGLSEGQMLYMLTKYKYGSEYSKTKATKGISYSAAYKVADKHKLATKATHSKNRSYASKTMTRGQFAQILASAHYGKKLSEKDAVKFMYSAGITNGNKGSNGKYAKTYNSYGVNTKVSRAYGVYMMSNYNTFLTKPKPKPKPPVKKPPAKPVITNNKVSVLYGSHTYESKTQSEYDAVVDIARKALQGVENGPYAQNVVSEKAYLDYLNGAKPITDRSNPNFRTEYNMALLYASTELTYFKDSGVSNTDIINFWKVRNVYANTDRGEDPGTGAPRSAYDALVRKITDCDSDAQVSNLFLDMKGYNTAVLGRPGHAFAVVKLGGEWRDITTFQPVNIYEYKGNVNGEMVISVPTKGY